LIDILLPFDFFPFLSFLSFLGVSSQEDFDMYHELNFSLRWFCLGYLFERKFILGSKRVQWKIYWSFGMKKH